MIKDKPCKYLKNEKDDDESFVDKVVCRGYDTECPKKKIKLKVTPHCWRIGEGKK